MKRWFSLIRSWLQAVPLACAAAVAMPLVVHGEEDATAPIGEAALDEGLNSLFAQFDRQPRREEERRPDGPPREGERRRESGPRDGDRPGPEARRDGDRPGPEARRDGRPGPDARGGNLENRVRHLEQRLAMLERLLRQQRSGGPGQPQFGRPGEGPMGPQSFGARQGGRPPMEGERDDRRGREPRGEGERDEQRRPAFGPGFGGPGFGGPGFRPGFGPPPPRGRGFGGPGFGGEMPRGPRPEGERREREEGDDDDDDKDRQRDGERRDRDRDDDDDDKRGDRERPDRERDDEV